MSDIKEPSKVEATPKKPTLVRRVSMMLIERKYSGPPMLFRSSSMQKIRHCCQNLNFFPYLLYSYDNSKSHPVAVKVNLCISRLFNEVILRLLFLYEKHFYDGVLMGLSERYAAKKSYGEKKLERRSSSFRLRLEREKPKQNNFLLSIAVYFASTIVAFQMIGLCSLIVFGKFSPGFIFLITALLITGCITLKIFIHDTVTYTVKCKKIKVQ